MARRRVPVAVAEAVRQLIDGGVRSLEQLEVLLVLVQDPGKSWPQAAVCRGALLAPQRVEEAARALVKAGVVARDEQVDGLRLLDRLDVGLLRDLRAAYEHDRSLVVNAFFAGNLDSLRSFANAFKLRRRE